MNSYTWNSLSVPKCNLFLFLLSVGAILLVYEWGFDGEGVNQVQHIQNNPDFMQCDMETCFNRKFFNSEKPLLFCFPEITAESKIVPEYTRINQSIYYTAFCEEHNAILKIILSSSKTHYCDNTRSSQTCLHIASSIQDVKNIQSEIMIADHSIQSIIASKSFSKDTFRKGYDIWLPMLSPFVKAFNKFENVSAKRSLLIGFVCGKSWTSSSSSINEKQIMDILTQLQNQKSLVSKGQTTGSNVAVKIKFYHTATELINCWGSPSPPMVAQEWFPCKFAPQFLDLSIFCLLIAEELSPFDSGWQAQASSCLASGSIPVIVGKPMQVHFDDNAAYSNVLWSQSVLHVSVAELGQLVDWLLSIPAARVKELQRNGRKFYRKYLNGDVISQLSMISTIMNRRLQMSSDIQRTVPTRMVQSVLGKTFHYVVDSPVKDATTMKVKSAPQMEIERANMQLNALTDLPLSKADEFDSEEKFTVVMLFHKRYNIAMETVRMLDNLARIKSVIMVWNDVDGDIKSLKLTQIHVPTYVIKMPRNSLNNRFLPFDLIETDAVLHLDDDTRIPTDDLELGFEVWKQHRNRIVGYPARSIKWDAKLQEWNYVPSENEAYSMILTGGAFLHKRYMTAYTWEMPYIIREMVDEFKNCEDIAMNFLISHIHREPPLKAGGIKFFPCKNCGPSLYTDPLHYKKRSYCINKLVDIYGYVPLLSNEFRAVRKA